jgi:polyhydroxybutyrate depolymerase
VTQPNPRRARPRLVELTVVLLLAAALGVAISGGAEGTPAPVAVAAAAPEPPTVERSVVVEGSTRTYRVLAPSSSTAALPLVVVLHGRGQSQQAVTSQTGFAALVDARRAVVIYADGVGRSWNAGHGCCGVAGEKGELDTAFIAAVVADAERTLPVDATRT